MFFLGYLFFFFSSRRRHTRSFGDWSSDVCSSDLPRVFLCLARLVTERFTRAMAYSSSRPGQHLLHPALILSHHQIAAAQLTLALGALLGEDVALVRLATLELAAGGGAEALGRGAIGLQLRHCRNSCAGCTKVWPRLRGVVYLPDGGRPWRSAFTSALAGLIFSWVTAP